MSDDELIRELERIAHTWENHPIHSDLAETLRLAARQLYALDKEASRWARYASQLERARPSPPSSGPLPRVPGDT
jgi:hypothetical protein